MLQSPNEDEHSLLVLGWQVTPDGHPIYWLKKDAEIGHHQDSDLVRVSADCMDSRTIIVAQSGSGKSFSPGRLIQELLIRTLCRCLIFDPNGDFSRMEQLNQDVWQDRAMIQILAMNYCLMKQMPTLRHLGEQSNHALGLVGIRPEG
jgi:hypothetical protein